MEPFDPIAEASRVAFLREKLKVALTEANMIGVCVIAGRAGRLGITSRLDADWSIVRPVEDGKTLAVTIEAAPCDFESFEAMHRAVTWSAAAFSGLAELLQDAADTFRTLSKAVDDETGATHSPLERTGRKAPDGIGH